MRSTVKFYNKVNGYGFIINPDGEKDIFFHHSQIIGDKKTIDEGKAVEFNIVQSPKGIAAEKVMAVA